jgi:hypothetical protein
VSSGIGLGSRRDRLAIPSAAAAAISQMLATVARLGGRAHIPWSPAIGPSVFGNSDGSGGVPGVGGAVGMLLDSSNGWGFASGELLAVQPAVSIAAWTQIAGATYGQTGGGYFTITSAGPSGGYFTDIPVLAGSAHVVSFDFPAKTGTNTSINAFDGAGFGTQLATTTTAVAGIRTFVVTPATNILRIYLFVDGVGNAGTYGLIGVRRLTSTLATALTQATGINKPLLASGAVPWAGALQVAAANQFMLGAAPSYITDVRTPRWFATCFKTGSNSQRIFSTRDAGSIDLLLQSSATNIGFSTTPGGFLLTTLGTVTAGGPPDVVGGYVSGTNYVLQMNNLAPVNHALPAAAVTPTEVRIGFADLLPGQLIHAVAHGPGSLSAAEYQVLHRGMQAIAGLPI